jgi:hypothetical protein
MAGPPVERFAMDENDDRKAIHRVDWSTCKRERENKNSIYIFIEREGGK